MIGNVSIKCTTYKQFTARVRRRMPTATKEEIYKQWCREDCDGDGNEAFKAISAEREKIRKAKITRREEHLVQPALQELCDLQGTTYRAGEIRRILVNLLRTVAPNVREVIE